ncbi:ATP cone domain-containing protein [Ascidiimonas sp. W6]|uniref:ATP cone domain-containing protein n=1 Tax=Ascidiimonas meishanensis TaxID=3128903 RepID=UPI0030EF3619
MNEHNNRLEPSIEIIKSSGDKVKFSMNKLRASLLRSGAETKIVNQILDVVRDELYQGISTKEIYNRAFALLKKKRPIFASKYKLKKAIYELGPTGFPFEKFIASLLKYSGYKTKVGELIPGVCVTHEVDILAHKNEHTVMIECKFHSDQGRKCNVKVPLYINSRYGDIKAHWNLKNTHKRLEECWVATNTRFTKDAVQYGNCAGLYLLSWDKPKGDSIRERIDRLGLHPLTSSTLLTQREKQFLLDKGIVLCRELKEQAFLLDHLGISDKRKEKILLETTQLCEFTNYGH